MQLSTNFLQLMFKEIYSIILRKYKIDTLLIMMGILVPVIAQNFRKGIKTI